MLLSHRGERGWCTRFVGEIESVVRGETEFCLQEDSRLWPVSLQTSNYRVHLIRAAGPEIIHKNTSG